MKRDTWFIVVVVLLFLAVTLLATTVQNEGCLPWQERARPEARCSGSWFPLGTSFP